MKLTWKVDVDGIRWKLAFLGCLWMVLAVSATLRRGRDLDAFVEFLTSTGNMLFLLLLFILLCPLPRRGGSPGRRNPIGKAETD